MDEDGFADPLLPQDGREQQLQQEMKAASRKLAALGLSMAGIVAVDLLLCSYSCSGGFKAQPLGMGCGSYPFGSSGLDLLVVGVVRCAVAVAGCLAFFFVVRRRSKIVESGSLVESAAPPPSASPAEHHGKYLYGGNGGGGGVGGDGEAAGQRTSSSSTRQVGAPRGSATSYKVSRWAQWLETICVAGPILSILLVITKCLARLVAGPGSGSGCGLETAWFWSSIGWSAAASGVEFVLAARFTSTCRGYCLLRCCRKRGDFEAILEAASEEEGGGKREKPAYSASFWDIVSLCTEDWRLIVLASIALLLAASSKVLVPHFTGNMIDNVVEGGGDSEFRRSAMYLVLAAVSCAIFSGIRGCIFSVVGARVNVRVRRRLFESLVRQEIGFFDTTKTGDLTSRLASDCTKVGDQVTLNVNVFLRNLVMVVVTLLFMFYLSWRLSLVAFISVPAIVIVSKWYGEYIRKLSKLSQDKLAEAGSVAEESLGSMSTVRSFAAEGRESKEYANKLQEFYVLSKRGGYAYGFYASSYVLLPNLVTAVVLFYGGQLVMDGQISGGKVVSFMIYLTSLSDGFNDMAAIFSSMTQAVGAADKVFELIRREPKGASPSASPPPSSASQHSVSQHSACETGAARSVRHATGAAFEEGGAAPETCFGAVELKGVDFEYPSRPGRRILDGVNFNAAAGQVLALVGPSGGGKSSCISLLENLYQPSRGQVLLDGLPVHEYDHRWLHRNISIVGQEPTLYARSIRENIIYGLEGEEPSMADVEEAARLANAHTFISQLPEKYETQAGERGVQISGGQKQRIAIARALVRKPKVLLLDEATSALDAESEHLVQHAIDNMISRGGMTVILIAHRLSTVKRADKIVVIRSGQVVEEGTHEELLDAKHGVYAGLVKRQLDLGESGGGGARRGSKENHRLGVTTTTMGLSKTT